MDGLQSDLKLFGKILIICLVIVILYFEIGESKEGLPNYSQIIPINLLDNYNKKSKEEILELRKNFVATSIIKLKDYEPSEEIFGEIEGNKPWQSMFACNFDEKYTYAAEISGSSKESRFINNPSILIGIDHPNSYSNNCTYRFNDYRSFPQIAFYVKKYNELHVHYNYLAFERFDNAIYSLNGLNARDLGFKYAYVDKSKTSDSIKFVKDSHNISNSVIKLQDKISLRFNCGTDTGCNNSQTPIDEVLFQKVKSSDTKSQIYIKLWRNMPNSPEDEADLTEIITIGSSIKLRTPWKYEKESQDKNGYWFDFQRVENVKKSNYRR